MYLEAEAERDAAKAEEAAKAITNDVSEIAPKVTGGVNQLPESFNQEQLSWLRAHGYVRDKDVLGYPKLYSTTHGKIEVPLNLFNDAQIKFFESIGFVNNGEVLKLDVSKSLPKNEKALKKLMKKLDSEHKERRMQDAGNRVGISNETVLHNSVAVPQNTRYNYQKYMSMEKERLTDADWQPEMTREEFMQKIEQYINEEIARTASQNYTPIERKETFLTKIKRKIGL